jgi:DNA polymerase IV
MFSIRKIIHIDMDCFFAAVEIRDNPLLKNKPVAVGGTPGERGVLSTCNYIARRFGLHSAMPSAQALKICPKLILLPVNINKYVAIAKTLRQIFIEFSPKIESLSLDEAFLDVTNSPLCQGSATLIAKAIKERVKNELNLTASAGVAPNKFLAKVASDWKKPDGLFVITPNQIENFMKTLPVEKIPGVGKVTAREMHALKLNICSDLQKLSLDELTNYFGKRGAYFYDISRGIDESTVSEEYVRKSLSVEETFPKDLLTLDACLLALPSIIIDFKKRLTRASELPIHKQFVKIKFSDFKQTTVEKVHLGLDENFFYTLLKEGFKRGNKPVRLLGVGVRFRS